MKALFSSILIIFTFFFASCTSEPSRHEDTSHQEEWLSLFNGKDLTGWDIKIAGFDLNENFGNTFRVEDSMIRIAYDQYESFDEKFGHMYYQQPFSYYKLKFQYRFVGEQLKGGAVWNVRNSGIMVHSQSAASNNKDQHFPVSIEVQLLGGLGEENGERHTGNLCTPGTRVVMGDTLRLDHCIDSDSKTYHGDQWVEMEAIVLGDSVIHHVIGEDTILTYYKPQIDEIFVNRDNYNWEGAFVNDPESWEARAGELLKSGYIALQAESHPIDFKDIYLLNLEGCMDPKAKNYKSYYVKADNSKCEF
jgi:hypothetical protein